MKRDGFGLVHGFILLLKRVLDVVLLKDGDSLCEIFVLAVFAKVVEVGSYDVGTLADDVGHDPPFVVGLGLAFLNGNRVLRTMAKARTQTVAAEIANESGLAINELDGALRTGGNAVAAAIAPLLVYLDNLPFHAPTLDACAAVRVDAHQHWSSGRFCTNRTAMINDEPTSGRK